MAVTESAQSHKQEFDTSVRYDGGVIVDIYLFYRSCTVRAWTKHDIVPHLQCLPMNRGRMDRPICCLFFCDIPSCHPFEPPSPIYPSLPPENSSWSSSLFQLLPHGEVPVAFTRTFIMFATVRYCQRRCIHHLDCCGPSLCRRCRIREYGRV